MEHLLNFYVLNLFNENWFWLFGFCYIIYRSADSKKDYLLFFLAHFLIESGLLDFLSTLIHFLLVFLTHLYGRMNDIH